MLVLAFELGLGALAVALAFAFGMRPWLEMTWNHALLPAAVLATIPMTVMIGLVVRAPWQWVRDLRRFIDERVMPAFDGMRWWAFGLISLAAGVGEELLFRGVVQHGLTGLTGPVAGLAATALLFGLAHAITPAYFVLTTIAGLYLGALYLATGNLLLPILVHFLYDWIALSWFVQRCDSDGRNLPPG